MTTPEERIRDIAGALVHEAAIADRTGQTDRLEKMALDLEVLAAAVAVQPAISPAAGITEEMIGRVEQAWPRVWLSDSTWREKITGLLEAALAGRTLVPDERTAGKFVVYGGWLAVEVDCCTCAAPEFGDQILHEPGCGLEPVVELAELTKVLQATGRTVIQLPTPTANGDYETNYSSVWVNGTNRVASAFGSLRPEIAEDYGTALIAAAREARRRASEGGDTRG